MLATQQERYHHTDLTRLFGSTSDADRSSILRGRSRGPGGRRHHTVQPLRGLPHLPALFNRPEAPARTATSPGAGYRHLHENPPAIDREALVRQVIENKAPVYLGKYDEIVVHDDGLDRDTEVKKTRLKGRKKRLRRRLRAAQALMPKNRIGNCGRRRINAQFGVFVVQGDHGAYFQNLQSCGSVHACPVCSDQIAGERRLELEALEAYAKDRGLALRLVTYTAPHAATDDAGFVLDRMLTARRSFRNSRTWRQIRKSMAGFVTALEVNYGQNGAHVHFHELCLFEIAPDHETEHQWSKAWTSACLKAGLDAPDPVHGLDIRSGHGSAGYLSKATWSAAHEIAGAGKRSNRSYTPFELLDLVEEGDTVAAATYRRHVEVFSGKRSLVWSQGLKAKVGVSEVSDEEAAVVTPEEGDRVIMEIGPEDWRALLHFDLTPELLETIEDEGVDAGWRLIAHLQTLYRAAVHDHGPPILLPKV